MFKYTLIISQYYHSRHIFIVHHTPDFIERARAFAAELMAYKRDDDCQRDIYLGDLDPEYCGTNIRPRYNINDSGDIYFLQAFYANALMDESWDYKNDSRREAAGFKSKKVWEDIHRHHDAAKVYEIVKRHFEIA
jgi:hypothetical protein